MPWLQTPFLLLTIIYQSISSSREPNNSTLVSSTAYVTSVNVFFFVLCKFQLVFFIVFLSDISKLMCLITKLLKYVYLQNDLLLLHFAHLSKCQFHGFIYLGYNLGVILDSKIIVCIQPTNTFCLSYRQNTRFPDILLGSTSTTQYKSPSSHTSLLQSPMCPSFHPCHRCSFIFQPKPN